MNKYLKVLGRFHLPILMALVVVALSVFPGISVKWDNGPKVILHNEPVQATTSIDVSVNATGNDGFANKTSTFDNSATLLETGKEGSDNFTVFLLYTGLTVTGSGTPGVVTITAASINITCGWSDSNVPKTKISGVVFCSSW